MVDKKVLAVIPARSGSKRIPNKNVIDFEGKPLIAWTIEAALSSNLFNKIIVSTDSSEIAEVSRVYGAQVPFLREMYSDDYSSVSQATLHSIQQLESAGEHYDIVVQLFAVCPLRNHNDIVEAYDNFIDQELDFQLSCYKYVWMNPWWAATLSKKGEPEWILKDTLKRSQDLPKLYSPTGAIWIAKLDSLKKEGTFYGKGHRFWEMNWKRAVDIDEFEDLDLAKALKIIDNENT